MSQWNEITQKDIDNEDMWIDDGELNIHAGYNDMGNIYLTIKLDLLKNYLKDNETKKK